MKLSEAVKVLQSGNGDSSQAVTLISEQIARADSDDTDVCPEMLAWLCTDPFTPEEKKVGDAGLNFFGFSVEMVRTMWRAYRKSL